MATCKEMSGDGSGECDPDCGKMPGCTQAECIPACGTYRSIMDSNIDLIIEKMERYGGSFVQALAALYRRADPVNQSKVLRTWANYFDEYSKI